MKHCQFKQEKRMKNKAYFVITFVFLLLFVTITSCGNANDMSNSGKNNDIPITRITPTIAPKIVSDNLDNVGQVFHYVLVGTGISVILIGLFFYQKNKCLKKCTILNKQLKRKGQLDATN